ncbi:MAG: SHOCT domain-containing protein [Anaerolineae bacterium]
MSVLWAALIAPAVWLVGRLFPRDSAPATTGIRASDPLAVLNERYARGEISRQEYQLIKQDLGL